MTTDRPALGKPIRPAHRGPRLLVACAAIAALALAAGSTREAAAAGPGDIPIRIPDQFVYDLAGVFDESSEATAESLAAKIGELATAEIVVVSETVAEGQTADAALARATEVRSAMAVGSGDAGGGLLIYFGIDPSGCDGQVRLAADETFRTNLLSDAAAQAIVDDDIRPLLASCDPDSALLVALGRIATIAFGLDTTGGPPPLDSGPAAPPPGPPFPDPAPDVAVYDTASIFRPETIAAAERTIDGIETRTGAEVVVYSQLVDDGRSTEDADADARALMDEWGIGRKGFDDGLVILFDMYPGRLHGQVILYGGPGFRATFLDNNAKQHIFDDDVLPRLRSGDLDGALLIALERVDAATTPEHAATLERARQLDAVVGLVGAPLALFGLVGSAVLAWRRYGRDPVYLDDPSIHMAGPPESLTPASAVFVLAGGSSRRALTTALLDVASRGQIAFREEAGL
ncbi:MAG TPA: TPM domain-containing protein, partial [Candidatus Limnocylindrales bacterium]|nr:TPM domain-containing protein [Candidatus Limnocylindrales bacterium]